MKPVAESDDRITVRDPLKQRFEAERPRATVERRQALADLEHQLFGRPRRVVTVSRYVLLKRIAAGGGGVVYSAFDPELDRKVAIKLIRTRGTHPGDSTEAAARLTREARAAAKLSHPNVVTVHDVGIYNPAEIGVVVGRDDEELEEAIEREVPSTGVFVVMEFIDGENLAQWCQREDRGWHTVLEAYLQAGDGLAAAHASSLIHRDFKPSNVMIGTHGRARVLDFGLARAQGEKDERPDTSDLPEAKLDQTIDKHAPLTREGAILGTPAYMPPEQHAGEPADERSDQYSFCAALWEGLSGTLPFPGDDLDSLAEAKNAERFSAFDEDKAPAWMIRALRRGLSARPEARFGSMRELLDELSHNPAESRLRLIIGSGLVVMLGALTATVLITRGDAEPVCPDPSLPLAGIWDDGRKAAIADAFASSDKSYAASTWVSAESAIDDYAKRWVAARKEACEATLVRQERSPELMGAQMLCLDTRLNRVAELTRLLATGDGQVIETAMEGVAMLAPLEACTDPKQAGTTLLPPIAVRDEVMAVDAELARAEALRRAGKLDDATAAVDAALEQAEGLDHPPLQARGLLLRGQIRSLAKDARGAEAALREALLIAESTADDDSAVRILVELGHVVGFVDKRHAEAGRILAFARAKLSRHNPGPHVEALLERNAGLLFLDQRQFSEAVGPLERARTLLADAYGEDSVQVTTAINALALLAVKRRDFGAAEAYYIRSKGILESSLGPHHPTVAGIVGNLGVIALEQGDWARAEVFQRQGLTILRDAVGDDHPYVAQALNNLAASLLGAGKVDEALSLQREALGIKRARLAPKDPSIANSLNNLGAGLNLAGRDEEALALHQEALAIRAEMLGADHPETAMSATNIGLSHLALRQDARAKKELTHAVESFEALYGTEDARLVEPLRGLSEVELRMGHRKKARAIAERALKLVDTSVVDPIQVADLQFIYAMLTFEEDPDGARDLADQAAEAYERLGDDNPRGKRLRAWLTEVG
jgi:serine/threonine protein kinase/tetratricopeptide (TPR) repeat protein